MPEPRISTQPVCLQTAQPEPPQTPHCTSISAEGSVKGKKLGLKRVGRRPKILLAKRVSIALRSTKLIPSSTHSPSICSNEIGRASCRERVEMSVVAGSFDNNK